MFWSLSVGRRTQRSSWCWKLVVPLWSSAWRTLSKLFLFPFWQSACPGMFLHLHWNLPLRRLAHHHILISIFLVWIWMDLSSIYRCSENREADTGHLFLFLLELYRWSYLIGPLWRISHSLVRSVWKFPSGCSRCKSCFSGFSYCNLPPSCTCRFIVSTFVRFPCQGKHSRSSSWGSERKYPHLPQKMCWTLQRYHLRCRHFHHYCRLYSSW